MIRGEKFPEEVTVACCSRRSDIRISSYNLRDMKRSSLTGKVAFVTGASSGIGEALAWEYARRGATVAVTARREDRLNEIAKDLREEGHKALPIVCDVCRDNDPEMATQAVLDEFGRLDHVVANAGFAVSGPLSKLAIEDYRRQFETNVFGVLRTVMATREALIANQGHLAIIGSVAGIIGLPRTSPYNMSKFAVHALAQSLRYEFSADGVTTTLVAPGFIDSEIRLVNNRGLYDDNRRENIPSWLRMRSDIAAKKIVTAIIKGKRTVIITGHGKIIAALARHTPWLIDIIIRGLKVNAHGKTK